MVEKKTAGCLTMKIRGSFRALWYVGVLFNKLAKAMMIIMTNEKIVAPNSIIRFVLVGMLL